MRLYSDPRRMGDPYALPDIEVFEATSDMDPLEPGWYFWYCLPGCLPDSDPCGPYATAAEAETAALKESGVESDEFAHIEAALPDAHPDCP